jgi:hypothetical protein
VVFFLLIVLLGAYVGLNMLLAVRPVRVELKMEQRTLPRPNTETKIVREFPNFMERL